MSAGSGVHSPAVVLVRTQEEGNLGAVARAMANMGLERLVLVDPRARIGRTARAFAVGAGHLLDAATTAERLEEALRPFQRVVGTSSARGRQAALPPITPRQLPALLGSDPEGTSTALVFGPEASGLTNDELAQCSIVVRIPCAPVQPTLNLAQAVLVVAYELHCHDHRLAPAKGEPPAPAGEIDALMEQAGPLLEEIGFARDDTFPGVLRDLRHLLARAAPRAREISILRGICRRAAGSLTRDR